MARAWLRGVALREKTLTTREMAAGTTLRVLGVLYLAIGSLAMIVTPIVGDGGPLERVLERHGSCWKWWAPPPLAVTAWLAWRAWRARKIEGEEWRGIAAVCLVTFNLLVVLAGVHEIFAYFGVSATGDAGLAEAFTISAWLMVYAAVLLAADSGGAMAFVRWQGLGAAGVYDRQSISVRHAHAQFWLPHPERVWARCVADDRELRVSKRLAAAAWKIPAESERGRAMRACYVVAVAMLLLQGSFDRTRRG